ncbi:rod-binding protein [Sphingomonas qilianensis]|uniref:Rod-binding protein n=1 Tax=Sphingomonas qilianensis TaxID=1736690 RepID=A0ABU9XTJ2_9SPHN
MGLPITPAAARLPQPTNDPAATAREFEAVFIGEVTKIMLESANTDTGFSGGHGEEMFRGVLAEELGKEIAKRGGVGLAPAVMDQIIRLQGGASDAR